MDDDTIVFGGGGQGPHRRRPGRTKRLITTSAVGVVLLGSGAAIGVALTGGASASTNSASASSDSASTGSDSASTAASPGSGTDAPAASATQAASRCTKLTEELVLANHVKLATRLHRLCTHPLLRIALVGGEHGTVTFTSKSGTTTDVFERGTVESDTGSVITVTAADGTTWAWDLTSSTVVRQAGRKATVSTGDQVFIGGTQVSGANDARLIRIRTTASSRSTGGSGSTGGTGGSGSTGSTGGSGSTGGTSGSGSTGS